MKVLTIKQYLTIKSNENIDEMLTQAFAEFLHAISSRSIRFEPSEFGGFFSTKLNVKFNASEGFPLNEIYVYLLSICLKENLQTILIRRLELTPSYVDGSKGIIATVKYIK